MPIAVAGFDLTFTLPKSVGVRWAFHKRCPTSGSWLPRLSGCLFTAVVGGQGSGFTRRRHYGI